MQTAVQIAAFGRSRFERSLVDLLLIPSCSRVWTALQALAKTLSIGAPSRNDETCSHSRQRSSRRRRTVITGRTPIDRAGRTRLLRETRSRKPVCADASRLHPLPRAHHVSLAELFTRASQPGNSQTAGRPRPTEAGIPSSRRRRSPGPPISSFRGCTSSHTTSLGASSAVE